MRNLRLLDAGVLRPQAKLSHGERAGQLHNSLFSILDVHRPQICVIEKAFRGINSLSAIRLGETRGALIAAARRLSIPIFEIAPTQVKKTLTGQGHASKEQISRAVASIAGFERGNMPFDVTDAIAIAITYGMMKPLLEMQETL